MASIEQLVKPEMYNLVVTNALAVIENPYIREAQVGKKKRSFIPRCLALLRIT